MTQLGFELPNSPSLLSTDSATTAGRLVGKNGDVHDDVVGDRNSALDKIETLVEAWFLRSFLQMNTESEKLAAGSKEDATDGNGNGKW